MSLSLTFVAQKDIASCKILKKRPSDTYVDFNGHTRLRPPVYDQKTMVDFNPVYSQNPPADTPPAVLWDYHYDLMNDFAWTRWLPITPTPPFYNKRHPLKFKYRLFRVVSSFDGTTITSEGWKEVEFAAVIMPNFRSNTDINVVQEDYPTPPALFEGDGIPSDALGRTGDYYFDLSSTIGSTARLYGPKVVVPGEYNTPQNPSVGKWITNPIPGFQDIQTTRNLIQFHTYKSKRAQIYTGLPNLELADYFGGGAQSVTFTYGDGAASYVPRWPTIPFDARPFATVFGKVKQFAFYKLPLFKPPVEGDQAVFPMWNEASDEPIWGLDVLPVAGHHHATTVRKGDYTGVPEIGVGNKPWPLDNRTESAIPAFGMWTEQQKNIDAFLNVADPHFCHALLYLPTSFVPVGGTLPIPSNFGSYHGEQINPVPIDPFFFDPDHPDGEYGTFVWPDSLAGGNFKGSNLHYATNQTNTYNPSHPDNPDVEIYFHQTTMIFDP